MGLRSVLSNLSKRGLKDILNKDKRKVFIRDFLENRYGWKILNSKEYEELTKQKDTDDAVRVIPKAYLYTFCEQVVYRGCRCGECVDKGNCLHCGCLVPANMIDGDNTCSADKWGEMLSEKDWNEKKLAEKFYLKIQSY